MQREGCTGNQICVFGVHRLQNEGSRILGSGFQVYGAGFRIQELRPKPKRRFSARLLPCSPQNLFHACSINSSSLVTKTEYAFKALKLIQHVTKTSSFYGDGALLQTPAPQLQPLNPKPPKTPGHEHVKWILATLGLGLVYIGDLLFRV